MTGLVREQIWEVWHRMGRFESFLVWCMENKDDFYKAFMRMASSEGPTPDGAHKLVVEIVKFASDKADKAAK
jgi:hypothetical protein